MKIIEGGKQKCTKIDYERIYLTAMIRTMQAKQNDYDNTMLSKRLVFYAIKYLGEVDLENKSPEAVDSCIIFNQMILDILKDLTPAELLTIFPPEKTYIGKKSETKDYYTTMEALENIGLDNPIGTEEAAFKLLWNYVNPTVTRYQVKVLNILSQLNKHQTGKELIDLLAENRGLNIPVNHIYTNEDGKTFLLDENGKSNPMRKQKPSYLKLM